MTTTPDVIAIAILAAMCFAVAGILLVVLIGGVRRERRASEARAWKAGYAHGLEDALRPYQPCELLPEQGQTRHCLTHHGLAVTFADDPSQCDKRQRFDA